jgi:hypothetical protein
MPEVSDTAPEIERMISAGYRQMPVWRKVRLVTDSYVVARQLHEAGHRLRNPAATPFSIAHEWAHMTLGPGPWMERIPFAMTAHPVEHVRAVQYVIAALDALDIPYAIGGSFASSVHGYPRQTHDADLSVEPFPDRVDEFVARFPQAEYYTDAGMVRDAHARRASFNILHLLTMFKVDVFVRKDRPFEVELMRRRAPAFAFGQDMGPYQTVTAEDSILLKLEWYRIGNEISDRQWGDIQGVMRTQADRLDLAYLHKWADEIGVSDLLAKALAEAGLQPF